MAVILLLTVAACGDEPQVSPPVDTPMDAPGMGDPVGPATAAGPPHLLAGPLDGRTGAYLDLRSPAATVTVRAGVLPGLLYRITTPAGAGLAPQVTGPAGVVRLGLRRTGDDGPDTVEIVLNRQVRWHIRLGAGAGEQHLDLGGGRISGVDLGAGAGLVRLRLPMPHGTVPIRMGGGVGRAELFAPAGAPIRVRLARGAAAVLLPWTRRTDSPPGSVLTPADWPTATNRYSLDVRASLRALSVRD
jgi:hypothetical protein